MKTIQKNPLLSTVVLFAVFVLSLPNVQAQAMGMADTSDEEKAQMLTEKQNEKISFYGIQEQEMYQVNLKYIQEMQRILAGGRSFSTMQKLQSMAGKKDKEVKLILDKKQFKTYRKMQDEMREQMRSQMGQGKF